MRHTTNDSSCNARLLLAVLVGGLACTSANAAVTILGDQYQPDQMFPEWDCFWHDSHYPTSCQANVQGATVHVYLKNTGASSVTISDATLAGYSLQTAIKMNTSADSLSSIYFNWSTPPADIMSAGEPVWYKADPATLPAGGVAQVAVRLRYVPTTPSIALVVVTSAGTVTTNLTVDANAPQLARIGYSADLTKVYLQWRRSGGAAPVSVWMDGTNVTSLTTTVGDPNVNFGASVVSLPAALSYFDYHVFQGVYADGKTATASQRVLNKFYYGPYGSFTITASYTGYDYVDEATDHGVNMTQENLGSGMGNFMGTVSGAAYCVANGFGYTISSYANYNGRFDPDMWFLNDEPDGEEDNQANINANYPKCLPYHIPCGGGHNSGTLVPKEVALGLTFQSHVARVPTMVNLDTTLRPDSYPAWGQAMDVLEFDNYYQRRLSDSYWYYPQRIPLYSKAMYIHSAARAACAGSEPNPTIQLLYSCEYHDPNNSANVWPFPTPESKRIEVYYSLAGGSKGIVFWWMSASGGAAIGLDKKSATALALWKEIGLLGNEIKTALPLIMKSTPVDMTLTPSANVWVRPMASGVDTLLLYVVNDNYSNDIAGCHYTPVSNATVTATLPLWLQTSPTAFEISAAGTSDVSTQPNGNQLQLNLGTLKLTRMIVLTSDPQLRTTIQQRYDAVVKPHVCNFAPELCTNSPPGITQQPVNRSVVPGGTTNFTVVASGSGTLGYRWQTNSVNLGDGGDFSGATTGTLTISGADSSDVVNYRCVVTNAYGSVTSSVVTLTITNAPTVPTANVATSVTDTTFTANWSSAGGATGYRLDVATDNGFGSFVSGYNNLDVGNVASRSVSGLTGGTPYYYRVRAYNAVGVSGNSGIINVTTTTAVSPPPGPVASAATGVTNSGFTANWSSANGATGYRLDVSTTTTFSGFVSGYNNLDVGNVLSWSVSGLNTGATYYYRVRAYNTAGSGGNSGSIAVTLGPANPCVAIVNADFEGGFSLAGGGYIANNWTEWEAYLGVTVGYDETVIVHGGDHSQRVRVSGTNATSGGVYQRLPVVAGQPYSVSVWMYAGDALTTCYLGVDPAGGTNAASGVGWSAGSTNVAWGPAVWDGIATGNYITVFYKVATPDNVKRNGYFDDATPAAPTSPLQLFTQYDGDALTLSWPECPGARLERADSLSAPVTWTTDTNQISTSGGQKSVTLTPIPQSGTGFFRLVAQ